MLSQLLENHFKVQEHLQRRRSTRKPLSCDGVMRECLKWNQEFPDAKVEFKILFPENFKAEGIKPIDEMCFIRELAQNQENPLQYPKVTPKQIEIFMQSERNKHLDNKRAVWRLEEELYEKKLDVVCDTLMKKLLEWNKNTKTEKIKFWIQTPLFWNHPDIKDTNGKYVHVVDLSETKLSPEEQERKFHMRFNSRIRYLDSQDLAVVTEVDTEYKEIEKRACDKVLNMESQRRIRSCFMKAHCKHLSESPEEYTFDESGKQLVLKSPAQKETTLARCTKEIQFRDNYMYLYDIEQQAVRNHPMALAFKGNSMALKFIRRKYKEEFEEMFFPEERYERLLMEGSPAVKPHVRPTKASCIILSESDSRKFRISRNIGSLEIFPVITEKRGMSVNKNSAGLEYTVDRRTELNIAAGDTSEARILTSELNCDQQAGLEEMLDKAGIVEGEEKLEKQTLKKYKTKSQQMWKETKQKKLVVIGKRRYSLKRQKNVKRIIADRGKAIGPSQDNSHEKKYKVNRSRVQWKATHLCRGRRSVSYDSLFDSHGQHQHSNFKYPFPCETHDDTILSRAKFTTGCTEKPEVIEHSCDLSEEEIHMDGDFDEFFTNERQPEVINKSEADIVDMNDKKEVQRPKFTSTSRYSITDDDIEMPKCNSEATETTKITIIGKILKNLSFSSSVEKVTDIQNQTEKAASIANASQHTVELVPEHKRKNIAFDLFNEPKKPNPKPKLSSDNRTSSGKKHIESTNHENSLQDAEMPTEEPIFKSQQKYIAFEIMNEPKRPKPKPQLSSEKRLSSGKENMENTNHGDALQPTKEPVPLHQRKNIAFEILNEPKITKPKPKLSSENRPPSGKKNNMRRINQKAPSSKTKMKQRENVVTKPNRTSKVFKICDEPKKTKPKPELLSPNISSSGIRSLPKAHRDEQSKNKHSVGNKQSVRCRDQLDVEFEADTGSRRIRSPVRWPSRFTPIDENKEYMQSKVKMPTYRIRILSTPRSYKYARLHVTANNPSKIPMCVRNNQQIRNHKATKNLNVVKSKFRYSRLNKTSKVASLIPNPWTKPEEIMIKLRKRNTQRKQSNLGRVCGDTNRLGRPKHREIPTRTRKRSKIPVQVKKANVPVGCKERKDEDGKYRKSRIPRRINGYKWRLIETDESREKVNVYTMYEFKTGLRKSRIPIPIKANKIINKVGRKGHGALKTVPYSNNKMLFHLPSIVQTSKPSENNSKTKLSVSPVHLPLAAFRCSTPLLEKLTSTLNRPASVAGYCVLPPIGKSRDVKRPMSAGANRKLLPPMEHTGIPSRPLSASGYAKLPPIPRRE